MSRRSAPASAAALRAHVDRVRAYYDSTNDLILRYIGRTYQVGLVSGDHDPDPYRTHNLFCAEQAGIRLGDRVLDAGCGNAGPSVHIAAAIDDVRVDAVTLSPVQARAADLFVREHGLAARVRLTVADFHALPYRAASFDVVLFLESAGHAFDRRLLFREAYRVLRPGGAIYIKDVFQREQTDDDEQAAIEEFNRVYRFDTAQVGATLDAVTAAGFAGAGSRDLSAQVSIRRFVKAQRHSAFTLNAFGHRHRFERHVGALPIYFADITARKPDLLEEQH
jgi:ubiquinone/menaquinone biosynthesis C-methylase UbiE